MNNLTGIYWIKNEAPYLPEYIEFHLLQGFDHFIFYDNNSTDQTELVLESYIKEGLVELRKYPYGIENINLSKNFWVMLNCIKEQKNKSKWIHFHAIDERIFCPDGRKITELLNDYDSYPGLCVGWKEFNSNGHIKKPKGLIIENYFETCYDEKRHIKTIIQPLMTLDIPPANPHCFHYLNGSHAVDENFTPIYGPFNIFGEYTMNKVKNHHYDTLSKEEFEIKMNKGLLDFKDTENKRRTLAEWRWETIHSPRLKEFITYDYELSKYANQVRENINKRFYNHQDIIKIIGL